MAIAIQCPACKQAYNLREDYAGQTVRCRQCQAAFSVGGSSNQAGNADGPLNRTAPGLALVLSLGMVVGMVGCCIGVPVLALTTLGKFAKTNAPAANRPAQSTLKQGKNPSAAPKTSPKAKSPAGAQRKPKAP
jgi:hypothetical protein